jgi:hypothetical protein
MDDFIHDPRWPTNNGWEPEGFVEWNEIDRCGGYRVVDVGFVVDPDDLEMQRPHKQTDVYVDWVCHGGMWFERSWILPRY